jgi:alpha-aminoadipate/glutamate carrier protein LysW
MATCPECDAEIDIDDEDLDEMEIGDPWDCEACGSRLRIANLDPLDFESDEEDEEEEEEEGEGEGGEEDAETDDEFDEDEDIDEDGEEDGGDWDE